MRWWAILAMMTVAGCGPESMTDDGPSRAEEDGPDICESAAHAEFVGQPIGAFDQDALDQPVRVIPPGGIVTMEYTPRRLNIDLDDADNIVRFWCG
ncbi:MAG: I78 family peptidase inhibitor [Roseovarius sp.]